MKTSVVEKILQFNRGKFRHFAMVSFLILEKEAIRIIILGKIFIGLFYKKHWVFFLACIVDVL